jgi:hypothetical protein
MLYLTRREIKNLNMKKQIINLLIGLSLTYTSLSFDITIPDGRGNYAGPGWYTTSSEINEVEPNCITAHEWDLQSFKIEGGLLIMTGGYNFNSPSGYDGFRPGDIFFSINNSPYKYVATVGTAGNVFDVYKLGDSVNTFYSQNAQSNPWRYAGNGELIAGSLTVQRWTYPDPNGIEYALGFDLNWLNSLTSNGDVVTVHNTMECGNDNLMGRYTVDRHIVPEPGTYVAGLGLVFGILLYKRHKHQR